MRPLAERELGTPCGAEQIRDKPELGWQAGSVWTRHRPNIRKKERRSAGRDHTAMNFGGFEGGVDRRIDGDKVTVSTQTVEKLS